ncbi:hypothetical protein FKP32DRAFT_1568901, partial [Trametes sanguinea]
MQKCPGTHFNTSLPPSYSPHIIPICLANLHIIYSAGLGSVVFPPMIIALPALHYLIPIHCMQLFSHGLLPALFLIMCKGTPLALSIYCLSWFYHQGQLRFEASVNEHNVGYLLGRTMPQAKHALSASPTCEEDESLWHQRCSHVNLDDLRSVVKKGLVSGLVLRSKRKPDPICEPYLAGKLNRHSIPRFASRRHTPLALVHTD